MTVCRVLVVSYNFWPEYAGWINQTLTMVRACDPGKLSFTWLTRRLDNLPLSEDWDYLTVRRIGPLQRTHSRFARVVFGVHTLRHLLLGDIEYDVIYLPQCYAPAELITVIASLLGKPVVVRVSAGELTPNRFFARLRRWVLMRYATATIVLNRRLFADCQRLSPSPNRIHWFPNGVDIRLFHPPTLNSRNNSRQRWGFKASEKIILFVGSIAAHKRVDTLVSAFARVVELDGTAVLCLAGPMKAVGDEAGEIRISFVSELQAFIRQRGLEPRVRFLGRVSDVADLMGAADVFVLPSLAEGMPNVLLEAMATGIPCVASDIPGIQELLTSGDNGLLFPPGDSQMLAAHLDRLLADPAERHRLGQRARQTIEQGFSIQETAQDYQALFLNLASRSGNATNRQIDQE